jgi:hypothetical protein
MLRPLHWLSFALAGLALAGAARPAHAQCMTWDPQFGPITGANGTVYTLLEFDDGTGPALYAGGMFTSIHGVAANQVAKWDGASWSPLGSGILGGVNGNGPNVSKLLAFDDGTGPALYAAGSFTSAGGMPAKNIARWDGSSWSALGSGTNEWIQALAVFDDGSGPALYVGGGFSTAGGVAVNRLARWNGTAWSAVGAGVGGVPGASVRSLATFDDGSGTKLYVGGAFTTAGTQLNARSIATWDGASWGVLGNGTNREIWSLLVFDDGSGPALYAGGAFTTAGAVTAYHVARWDGSVWSNLGGGLGTDTTEFVNALAAYDDGGGPKLYAGGYFQFGAPARWLASWDGTNWSPFAVEVDGWVRALATFDDGSGAQLYFAGGFFTVDALPAHGIARWTRWRSSRSTTAAARPCSRPAGSR